MTEHVRKFNNSHKLSTNLLSGWSGLLDEESAQKNKENAKQMGVCIREWPIALEKKHNKSPILSLCTTLKERWKRCPGKEHLNYQDRQERDHYLAHMSYCLISGSPNVLTNLNLALQSNKQKQTTGIS